MRRWLLETCVGGGGGDLWKLLYLYEYTQHKERLSLVRHIRLRPRPRAAEFHRPSLFTVPDENKRSSNQHFEGACRGHPQNTRLRLCPSIAHAQPYGRRTFGWIRSQFERGRRSQANARAHVVYAYVTARMRVTRIFCATFPK